MNTRLEQFLAAENITQAAFADKLKVARASISHILSGRNKPGYDFLVRLMKCYPSLNIEWLISGQGRMYKEDRPALRNDDYAEREDYGLFSREYGQETVSEPEASPSGSKPVLSKNFITTWALHPKPPATSSTIKPLR